MKKQTKTAETKFVHGGYISFRSLDRTDDIHNILLQQLDDYDPDFGKAVGLAKNGMEERDYEDQKIFEIHLVPVARVEKETTIKVIKLKP